MAIELRLREQLLNSTIKVDKRSQYYGTGNVVPVVALRMIYEVLSDDSCGIITLTFKKRKKLELLANNIIIKNKDICKLRGPNTYFKNGNSNTPILTSAGSLITPKVSGNAKIFNDGLTFITFSESDFTKNFTGGTPTLLSIITKPAYGTLTYDGEEITAGILIELSNIDKLIYTRIDGELFIDPFYFKVSNNETEKTFSNMATFTVNVDGEINQPATIGDGSTTGVYGATITFTRAMFTSATTPAYSDPEGDAAATLKITVLPTTGTIKLSGTNITVNDEFDFTTQIDAGLLTFVPDNAETDSIAIDFVFGIADAGSGVFVY